MAAGAAQLGGELLPRRPGAHDEHAAVRQLLGPAVVRGVELVHATPGRPRPRRGRAGMSQSPVAIDDVGGAPGPAVGGDVEAARAARATRRTVVCSRTGAPAA